MVLRRLFSLLLCLMLLAACGPATPKADSSGIPSASAAVEPPKSITADPFTIALLSLSSSDENDRTRLDVQQKMLARVQGYLNALGWRVTLLIKPMVNPEDGTEQYVQAIQKDMASGAAADGYQVDKALAEALRKQQLTQDAGPLAQRAAPQLYEQLKYLRGNNVAGIPYHLLYWPKGRPAVLYLDTKVLQAYGKPIHNANDLMTFLENTQQVVLTSFLWDIRDVWAAQRGYYSLVPYGMPQYYYARFDDDTCEPVPLEKIEGFDAFLPRVLALETQGNLADLSRYSGEAVPCGYLGPLTRRIQPQLLSSSGKAGADYQALPMDGCSAPALDTDDPEIFYVMALRAGSPHGDALAAFAQWGLASPDGYALCNYGKQDIDYRESDAGIEYLKDGMPLSAEDWNLFNSLMLPAMCTMQGTLFYNDELERANIYEAANADTLFQQLRPVLPPIWRVRELRHLGWANSAAAEITKNYGDELQVRSDALTGNSARYNGVPEFTDAQLLEQLQAKRPQLDEMTQKLWECIQAQLSESGSGS